MRDSEAVQEYLEEVEVDLDAARRLIKPPPNRHASYHLQQAAEKLVKAIRSAHGQPATKDHDIWALLSDLDPNDPFVKRMAEFDYLTAYATAYRYPGDTATALEPKVLTSEVDEISRIVLDFRAALVR